MDFVREVMAGSKLCRPPKRYPQQLNENGKKAKILIIENK
jgi:hypothetical protein